MLNSIESENQFFPLSETNFDFDNVVLSKEVEEMMERVSHIITHDSNAVELLNPEELNHSLGVQEKFFVLGDLLLRDKSDFPEFESILTKENLTEGGKYASLHDIGKVFLDDEILYKVGIPNAAEWAHIQSHAFLGALAIYRAGLPTIAQDMALLHHQWYNGQHHGGVDENGYLIRGGYPLSNIKGDAIPMEVQMLMVLDVFDALERKRSYKESWSKEKIIAELKMLRGTQFKSTLLDLVLDNYEEFSPDIFKYS